MEKFIREIFEVFERMCQVLKTPGLKLRVMQRRGVVNTKKSYTMASTNLGNKTISIDILTPKKRQPKKMSSIVSILCHEIAHHQKPPYRQRWRGRIITRQHFPVFYRQVNRNLKKMKGDSLLSKYFT